jgi:hypothetical protein
VGPFRTRPNGRGRRWIVGAVVAVAVGILLLVVYVAVPLPHSFAFQTAAGRSCGAASENASYPDGARVSGSWVVVSIAFPAIVEILMSGVVPGSTGTSPAIYSASGTNGTFGFTSNGGAYVYEILPATQQHVGCEVAPAVSIQGSWEATLYQSPL